jgi:hypothetical protein
MGFLECIDSKAKTATILLSVASFSFYNSTNNQSSNTLTFETLNMVDGTQSLKIESILPENRMSMLIEGLNQESVNHQRKVSEFNSKRNRIIFDEKLSSKMKGRIIFELTKKYFPEVESTNDEIYKNELAYFVYLRPEA